jgi:hypothetical protein
LFFCCAHGGEKIVSHDVVRDVFVSIVRDANFHVLREHTHVVRFATFFQSFHPRVNIVLMVDGICTLVDVVIVNPI